ncbi:hypothetical protein [Mycoplasmoides pirum]|uniref:hypothetical protein n=1 Tax=Mycoplasmoides pirum TaxID=2122 RepID=UPI00047FA5C0|nr:hypothetical protein [Mycoplasmoides pirum]
MKFLNTEYQIIQMSKFKRSINKLSVFNFLLFIVIMVALAICLYFLFSNYEKNNSTNIHNINNNFIAIIQWILLGIVICSIIYYLFSLITAIKIFVFPNPYEDPKLSFLKIINGIFTLFLLGFVFSIVFVCSVPKHINNAELTYRAELTQQQDENNE